MAIQVSGVNVIDNQRNLNVGVLTATSVDVPPTVVSFSPADGASDVSLTSNIVITFNTPVAKGTGNITLRSGGAGGSVIETIDVTSGSVSISGGAVTINPSDFPTGNDIYVVVDENAIQSSALASGIDEINTYNFSTGRITTSSFSPSDGANDQSVSTNIVITFSENIAKGSGNIYIRSGSSSGTTLQTIAVTSGNVSVSGTQATINPPSDMAYDTDQYIVVEQGCFLNAAEDANSGNAEINTYNFTTEPNVPPLGSNCHGGCVIASGGNNIWIAAPSDGLVCRYWTIRDDANNRAQSLTSCSGWFVPSCSQSYNPVWTCRNYWNPGSGWYWTNSQSHYTPDAWRWGANYSPYNILRANKPTYLYVRSFRCVSY